MDIVPYKSLKAKVVSWLVKKEEASETINIQHRPKVDSLKQVQ